jgi:hypothetical protein
MDLLSILSDVLVTLRVAMLGLLRARQSFGHVQAVALASMIEISSAGWQSSGRKECRKKMWNKTVDSTEREREKKKTI